MSGTQQQLLGAAVSLVATSMSLENLAELFRMLFDSNHKLRDAVLGDLRSALNTAREKLKEAGKELQAMAGTTDQKAIDMHASKINGLLKEVNDSIDQGYRLKKDLDDVEQNKHAILVSGEDSCSNTMGVSDNYRSQMVGVY